MAKSKKKKHNSFFGARLTSTISTSLVLFLLGIIAFMGVMATQLTRYVRENMGFSIVLDENVTDAQVKTLQKRLTAAPYARRVQYISKADALRELYVELGENPEDLLGYNPLRPSFEVKLHSDYADAARLAEIDKTLRSAYPYIENISYQKDLIELVNDNLRLIGMILAGIAVVMTIISFVLIANTVSLVAYSKRFLLHTMELVGAKPAFMTPPLCAFAHRQRHFRSPYRRCPAGRRSLLHESRVERICFAARPGGVARHCRRYRGGRHRTVVSGRTHCRGALFAHRPRQALLYVINK